MTGFVSPGLMVVGASYAGLGVAASVRDLGYGRAITLISDEKHAPYHRPPLSKGILSSKTSVDELVLRGADFYAENGIDLRLGKRVTRIDRDAGCVEFSDNETLAYDQLVLACGARARRLEHVPENMRGVLYLRDLDDAMTLKERLASAKKVVIVGGGFIGLEVASAASVSGKAVTILEAGSRLLERAVAPAISTFLLQKHRAHGVSVRLGTKVAGLRGEGGEVAGVVTNDGVNLECDLLVAGIGAVPNTELAAAAGLDVADGIVVDEFGRTSDPRVFAVGDCCRHYNGFLKRHLRIESVQNATDQARCVASTIAGKEEPHFAVPRFWSNQYDLKLQIVGIPSRRDLDVVRGDPASERFSIFSFDADRLTAVDSISRSTDHVCGRLLIQANRHPTPAQVEDLTFDLRSLL